MIETVAYAIIGGFIVAVINLIVRSRQKHHDAPCSDLRLVKQLANYHDKKLQDYSRRLGELEKDRATQEERDSWVKKTFEEILDKIKEIDSRLQKMEAA